MPLRIGSVPGRSALRGLAEDAAAHALSFLSNYFSMPYPADKLDHIGIPDFAAGAMENLGLVTYRETALLVARESSQVERQTGGLHHRPRNGSHVVWRPCHHALVGGHMAERGLCHLHGAARRRRFRAGLAGLDELRCGPRRRLAADSLHASRAIEYPVGRPEEADNMFDAITYDKGGSVLRMIERYLGEDTFRRGLNLYLDKHRYSNTDTKDLWEALEVASGQPVQAVMGTWVNQAGHPVVSVELTGPSELRVSQSRFFLDGTRDDDQRWVVPLTLRYATADGTVEHRQLLLKEASATVALEGEPAWVLVNEGSWGVYRTHYDDELRRRLYRRLDQLGERGTPQPGGRHLGGHGGRTGPTGELLRPVVGAGG